MAEKQKTAIRKEQLTQAVLDVAGMYGIKQVSVAMVARKVGMVPSAIYRHFRSKEAMIDAVLDFIGARLIGNLNMAVREAEDPVGQLQKLVRKHLEMIRANSAIPRIIFSEDILAAVPGRKARVYGFIQTYLAAVAKLLRTAQKKRAIRNDASPETLAYIMLGLVQPAALLWYLSDGEFEVTRQSEKAFSLFKELLKTP